MLERFKQLTRAVVGCEKVGLSEDDVPTYKSTFDRTMWYSVEEEYFTRLLAFVFQKPGSLPGVDVLIVDPPNEFGTGGTGKDTHGLVLRAMAGKEYCISCKPEQVFGCRFPVDFTQCKFMFYSEGKITEQQAEDHKNHTTEEECTIERKYEGADKNTQHFELQIQYSNETRKARHFDNGTRRSFVAKASSTLKRTVGWFDDFYGGRSRPYRFEKPHVGAEACHRTCPPPPRSPYTRSRDTGSRPLCPETPPRAEACHRARPPPPRSPYTPSRDTGSRPICRSAPPSAEAFDRSCRPLHVRTRVHESLDERHVPVPRRVEQVSFFVRVRLQRPG